MIRLTTGFVVCLLLGVSLVGAQSNEPTSTPGAILGPVTAVTATPTSIPADDPRLAICSAPLQPGFIPHIVRPGDRLADLLIGAANLNVTQIAALNCLDDPNALPSGATIWLPPGVFSRFVTAEPFDPDPASDNPRILRLEASAETVRNQDGLVFTWEATGSAAYFYLCPAPNCERPISARPVPLEYTTPIIEGFAYAGALRFRLEVVDGDAARARDITVNVICSQESLAPTSGDLRCPDDPPFAVAGAWQPFQNGLMFWFSDARQIWVLTRPDSRVQIFPDVFQEGMSGPQVTPPEGLYVPERGFGLVWEQLGGGDSLIGWASAPEDGVQFQRQTAGIFSYTVYVQGPDENVYAATLIPGQDAGYWTHVAP